jgi:hypothetical protein
MKGIIIGMFFLYNEKRKTVFYAVGGNEPFCRGRPLRCSADRERSGSAEGGAAGFSDTGNNCLASLSVSMDIFSLY